jgi:hypothetical protein
MAYWCDDQELNLQQRRLDAEQARAAERMKMREFEFHDYGTGVDDGTTRTEATITTERFEETSAARAHAGRLSKKSRGPVDLAKGGGEPWADRYITTASPSEHHAAGYQLERIA